MIVFNGSRSSGKTKTLIRYCLDNDIAIACYSPEEKILITQKSIAYFNQVVKTVLMTELSSYKEPVAIDEYKFKISLDSLYLIFRYISSVKRVLEICNCRYTCCSFQMSSSL